MSSETINSILLSLAALAGHFSFCIFAINRLHSTRLSRNSLRIIDAVWYAYLFIVPLAVGYWLKSDRFIASPFVHLFRTGGPSELLARWYFVFCLAMAAATLIHRAAYLLGPARGFNAATSNRRSISIRRAAGRNPAGKLVSYLATHLPLNEILTLSINDKTLQIPRLDPALEGLTITHLSDLHLTGQWDLDFYRVVVDEAIGLKSDLITITGDIIENPRCLPWVENIFGRLKAPLGAYYILGNHDQRIRDELAIHDALAQAGLTDLGGKWLRTTWRDRPLLLAGNELPWFPRAANLDTAPTDERALRIALSHAPDQLPWARRHEIDLLLAGHTHGGQVRIPGFGPLLCPSRYGVKYASGVFVEMPTVMHVSRGIAGTRPLRFWCPPEITRITLTRRVVERNEFRSTGATDPLADVGDPPALAGQRSPGTARW